MNNLSVSLVQSHLHWEDTAANLTLFSNKLNNLKGRTDLIILPEMFTTGFSMNASPVAEKMGGQTMQWLKNEAIKLNAAITGSLIIEEQGRFYNRLIFMKPDGTYEYYDKRHLFTLAKEHHTYEAGNEKVIIDWKGWKICPLICYDLRFPVWSRNAEDYDLLIYVANWPETRAHHWKTLLTARAIENQCYTIGVNRIGTDESGLTYIGDSSLIDYYGTVLYCTSKAEDIFTMSISKEEQENYRSKLNFLPDRDSYQIL